MAPPKRFSGTNSNELTAALDHLAAIATAENKTVVAVVIWADDEVNVTMHPVILNDPEKYAEWLRNCRECFDRLIKGSNI